MYCQCLRKKKWYIQCRTNRNRNRAKSAILFYSIRDLQLKNIIKKIIYLSACMENSDDDFALSCVYTKCKCVSSTGSHYA